MIKKIRYDFVVVTPRRFFGHEIRYLHARPLRVTDLERTLLDNLSSPERAGGIEAFWDVLRDALPNMNTSRLAGHLRLLRAPGLAQRMGYLLARLDARGAALLKPLMGRRIVLLDAHAPAEGPVDPTWKVRLNAPLPD